MTKRTLLLIIGGVLALGVAVFLLLASGDNSGQLQQRLSARQDTTLKLIAEGQKNISDDDLAKVNSELSIILHGDDTALSAALKTAGLKKVDKVIKAAEADTESFDALTTAKLNAQYDSTYQNILTSKRFMARLAQKASKLLLQQSTSTSVSISLSSKPWRRINSL